MQPAAQAFLLEGSLPVEECAFSSSPSPGLASFAKAAYGASFPSLAPPNTDPYTGLDNNQSYVKEPNFLWKGYRYQRTPQGTVDYSFNGGDGAVVHRPDFGASTTNSAGTFTIRDNKLGSYHLMMRRYDIASGRFTSPDPIAEPIFNLYSYCGHNPINRYDHRGESRTKKLIDQYQRNTDNGFFGDYIDAMNIGFSAAAEGWGRLFGTEYAEIPVRTLGNVVTSVNSLPDVLGNGEALADIGLEREKYLVDNGYSEGMAKTLALVNIFNDVLPVNSTIEAITGNSQVNGSSLTGVERWQRTADTGAFVFLATKTKISRPAAVASKAKTITRNSPRYLEYKALRSQGMKAQSAHKMMKSFDAGNSGGAVFHFTTVKGAKGILNERAIRPSSSGWSGSGVYAGTTPTPSRFLRLAGWGLSKSKASVRIPILKPSSFQRVYGRWFPPKTRISKTKVGIRLE